VAISVVKAAALLISMADRFEMDHANLAPRVLLRTFFDHPVTSKIYRNLFNAPE
jgi:hypothetical protein